MFDKPNDKPNDKPKSWAYPALFFFKYVILVRMRSQLEWCRCTSECENATRVPVTPLFHLFFTLHTLPSFLSNISPSHTHTQHSENPHHIQPLPAKSRYTGRDWRQWKDGSGDWVGGNSQLVGADESRCIWIMSHYPIPSLTLPTTSSYTPRPSTLPPMCYNVMAGATAVWVPPPPPPSLAVHACTFEHQSKQLLFVLAEGGLQAPGELSLLFKSWSEPESVVCFWYFLGKRQLSMVLQTCRTWPAVRDNCCE